MGDFWANNMPPKYEKWKCKKCGHEFNAVAKVYQCPKCNFNLK